MSAIPAVEQALLEVLEAAKPCPVEFGKPEPGPTEFVSIWEATSKSDFGPIGHGAIDELIDIMLVIDVALASGQDFRPPKDRAWKIHKTVEAAVRADLSLKDTWLFSRISENKGQYFRTDKRRGYRIFLTLSGKARI